MHDDALGDDSFSSLLAARDQALAEGADSSRHEDSPDDEELRARLDRASRFLKRVHSQFTRSPAIPSAPTNLGSPSARLPVGGATFDRFQLLEVLGQGGFGIVYLALDPRLNRKIALKVPRPDVLLSASLRERFLREARAVARMNHPNIVTLFESGEVGPICYLVSAYCPGKNLASWLRGHAEPMSPRAAARLTALLADAVQHAHECGVLHRDLKPANVLLSEECVRNEEEQSNTAAIASRSSSRSELADRLVPHITDFGLARILDSESSETQTNIMVGTPAYMAPEQAQGERDQIGKATDIYALGVLLYEMLAGRPPFQAGGILETLRQIVQAEPPSLASQRTGIPRDLEAITARCLAKAPADRYRSAGDLALDLRRFLAGKPTAARPAGPLKRGVKWARRRPALTGLLLVIACFCSRCPWPHFGTSVK